jgi:small subunit ribosomal protein S4
MRTKEKSERKLGEHLHLKGERCLSPKCALVRRPYRPGVHGRSRRRKILSDFGKQIQEKQKFKLTYGVDEKNLKQIFKAAVKNPGSTSLKILESFERRLDNVVFRLGLASSRSMARQHVVHGHIFVNKKRVKSPGFQIKSGDVISIRPESISKSWFKNLKEPIKKYDPPEWLRLDPEKLEGHVLDIPKEYSSQFEVNLLVESFNK